MHQQPQRVSALPLVVVFGVAAMVLPNAGAGIEAQGKDEVIRFIETQRDDFSQIAMRIWELSEVGYQETESVALLKAPLDSGGFEIEQGVAGMPTAFIASWGQGAPVIAILAEYDALPGISQQATTERAPRSDVNAGHACGHHLFGTASTVAALAVKQWLVDSGTGGTIRLYGTPAEEGGAGKVYMVREGLFDDVDAVLAWHPSDRNDASPSVSLANISAKFRFHGVSAHAAGAPDQGRSALDGVEAMNYMVNLLREHVDERSRIHYVITRGGEAPNVVPDFAEVYYYGRHPEVDVAKENWERIVKASQGAALGTGTTVEHEVIHGLYNMLPNHHLGRLLLTNLTRVGGFAYDEEQRLFAEGIQKSLLKPRPIGSQERVEEFVPRSGGGSTDVADISWIVPTAQFNAATWVPGTPAHSWQAVASGGTSIGTQGMVIAAKTLALTAVDLFADPGQIATALAELTEKRGPNFVYDSLVGDRDPPLDYRR